MDPGLTGAGVTITIEPTGVVLAGACGMTIWEALQRAGFTMFMGCRRGGCGVCRIRLEAGEVHLGSYADQALPPNVRAQGYILACRASLCGSVVIRVDRTNRLAKRAGWEVWATPRRGHEVAAGPENRGT